MATTGLRRAWMSRRRLRGLLLGLWLLLVLPSLGLILQTERQIKWEAFHQYRALAEELSQRIHHGLIEDMQREDARSVGDYQFLTVGGDPSVSRLLQRSPLAAFPPGASPSGLLGHFQVDAGGRFSTPLLPPDPRQGHAYGLSAADLQSRGQRSRELLDILARNELLAAMPARASADAATSDGRRDADASDLPSPAETQAASSMANASPEPEPSSRQSYEMAAQAVGEPIGEGKDSVDNNNFLANQRGFDELQSSTKLSGAAEEKRDDRLDALRLRDNFADAGKPEVDGHAEEREQTQAPSKFKQERASRKEQIAELGGAQALDEVLASLAGGRVRLFEGELDPFEFSLLSSGHGVLYRKVWRDGQRWIQGLLFDQDTWLQTAFADPFRASQLAAMSDLRVIYRGDVLRTIRGEEARTYSAPRTQPDDVLLQSRLPAPYAELQLVWTINQLPIGPGARAVRWTGGLLLVVLTAVFVLLYRLGGRQIDLARQQQDFVSAVSHELKTPLTSIRMYGELLLQGWASDDKKREYYGFIHDESERLSRLIGNVLQLARMERNELQLRLVPQRVDALMDLARSKIAAQVERAGFALDLTIDADAAERSVQVDSDALLQILINLIDNALKFSAHAARKQVDLHVACQSGWLCLRVRDYGPGVARDQLQQIFRLFYRGGNELTRETVGTGIGLALARQLAQSMGGELTVCNREPGAEFEIRLPLYGTNAA